MKFIDLDDLESDRNFWLVVIGFTYIAGVLQLILGEVMLGVVTLGMAVVLTAVAHQKLKEE